MRSKVWNHSWAGRGLVVAALLSTLGHAHIASADDSKDKDEARSLMQSGLKLFNDKDYLGALATFKSAYKQFASTKILLNIGTTLRQLNRNAEAANTYFKYLQAKDSDPTKRADVEKVLAELDAKVAVVTFTTTPDGATVVVNSDDPIFVQGETQWRVAPGTFKIAAKLEGYEPYSSSGTVLAGQTKTVAIEMVALPEAPDPEEPRVIVVEPGAPTRFGAVVRTHIDVKNRGAAVLVGGFYDVHKRIAVQAAGIIGPTYGAYLGATVSLLTGKVRPQLSVGAPVFFSDGARWAARAAVGVDVALGQHLSLFAEVGGEHHFNPETDITKTIFIPALGILGRL